MTTNDAGQGVMLPCPFCGADAHAIGISYGTLITCRTSCCAMSGKYVGKQEWNTRAPAPPGPAGTMKKIEAHNWEPFNIDEAREYLADCLVEHKSKHTGIFAVAHSLLAIIDGKAKAVQGVMLPCPFCGAEKAKGP